MNLIGQFLWLVHGDWSTIIAEKVKRDMKTHCIMTTEVGTKGGFKTRYR